MVWTLARFTSASAQCISVYTKVYERVLYNVRLHMNVPVGFPRARAGSGRGPGRCRPWCPFPLFPLFPLRALCARSYAQTCVLRVRQLLLVSSRVMHWATRIRQNVP